MNIANNLIRSARYHGIGALSGVAGVFLSVEGWRAAEYLADAPTGLLSREGNANTVFIGLHLAIAVCYSAWATRGASRATASYMIDPHSAACAAVSLFLLSVMVFHRGLGR